MAEPKKPNWYSVINCAVSNSFQRNKIIPQQEMDSIQRYMQTKNDFSAEEKDVMLANIISNVKEQVIPVGHIHAWAKIGIMIGILGIISSVFNLIVSSFSFIFVLFLIVAMAIVKPCIKCIDQEKNNAKAAKIWNQSCKNGNAAQMDRALLEMEAVLVNG